MVGDRPIAAGLDPVTLAAGRSSPGDVQVVEAERHGTARIAAFVAQREKDPALPPVDVDDAEIGCRIERAQSIRTGLARRPVDHVEAARGELVEWIVVRRAGAIDRADMAIAR